MNEVYFFAIKNRAKLQRLIIPLNFKSLYLSGYIREFMYVR